MAAFVPAINDADFIWFEEDCFGGFDGAESLSNPSAIISKKRFLEAKFLPRRWRVASKGFVRSGVLEHRTVIIVCVNNNE